MAPLAAETVNTALGPIEVERAGEGPPVLVVHGTPGGCDAGLELGRFLLAEGFSLIAPSRPGYLGTPLAGRESPDQQAALLGALLDELGLDRVALLCWSGGGPSSWALAASQPERVTALAAAAAVSRPLQQDVSFEERFAMRTRFGNWIARQMLKRSPESAIGAALRSEGTLEHRELDELTKLVDDEPEMRDFVLSLTMVVGTFKSRRAGYDKDWHHFAALATPDFASISAPTLLIHGDADAEVDLEHSETAAVAIPDAELLEMARGTHVALWAHADSGIAKKRVAAHLRR